MFSIEIRVNTQLIGHIYCRNVTPNDQDLDDINVYKYNYYKPETGEVYSGHVKHKRDDGIERLVQIILNNIKL